MFTKKTDAAARLHREATWDDAVAEYKGVLKEGKNPDKNKEMPKFRSLYKQLLESSK